MFIAFSMMFLGLMFGYVLSTGRMQSLIADRDQNETRANILEEEVYRLQREKEKICAEKQELMLDQNILHRLEDTVTELIKQRDEARAVAEKYFNLYKELRSKELGAKMIRELKGKTV